MSSSPEDTILEVRDVSVTFEMERGKSRVLDSVDMSIEREEILGIVGESGSGKSMFASALLDAVVDPGVLSGSITYYPSDGSPVNVLDLDEETLRRLRWEEISMVFQGAMSSFNPTISIRKHFVETFEAHDVPTEEGLDRAQELLSDLHLDAERVLDSYPHELSGGMKQRALIALSMVLEPEVLVMDEPTAALDLLMQRSILQLLENIQEKYDLTIIFITHDLALVTELADRMAVMYAFEFVEYGRTSEILNDTAHPYTDALLRSTPDIDQSIEEMQPIAGSSPDPVNVPSGCSYHPRCPLSDETCTIEDPGDHAVSETHAAACFYWEDVDDLDHQTVESDFDAPVVDEENPRAGEGAANEVVVSLNDVEVHFEERQGRFSFRSDPRIVRAVDGVSLDITENDVVALVGESGCGKTTLGKTSIGLQRPTGGSIKYREQDIWEARDADVGFSLPFTNGNDMDVDIPFDHIRKHLQIIHQDPGSAINPYRKVLSTISKPLKKWYPKLDEADRIARINALLETVGMTPPEDYAQRYPHQLSGGEKQRVALIQSLLMNPDLILADEAVSALDVSLRIEMMDLMLELQNLFDTSYLFISHDLSNARYITEKVGGRIGIMYLGKLVEIGPPEQILRNPAHPYTKALVWAAPSLVRDQGDADGPPVRKVDIPDPIDPPSGCSYHTRCPEAREVCTRQEPGLQADEDGKEVACFRSDEDHEYWDSESIVQEKSPQRT